MSASMRSRLAALAAASLLAACSADRGPSACVPGATQECACAAGAKGVQACDEDGAWSACDCGADAGDDGGPDSGADSGPDTSYGCSKVDILFVIDNSDSMSEEQTALVASFPGFIDAIEAYEVHGTGGPLDYHVGVTSTAVDHNHCGTLSCTLEKGDDGVLLNAPVGNGGVCDPPAERYMTGPDPAVKDEFACVAALGTLGWPWEMPFEAIRRGMTDGNAGEGHASKENAGFLRDDALFVAIVITDEDDTSRENTYPTNPLAPATDPLPVSHYVDAFLDIKPSYEQMAFGIIAGPLNTDCNGGSLGGADASPRLHELLAAAGDNGAFGDICSPDFADAVAAILDTILAACDEMPQVD
jgi:hypothetical protein